MKPHRVLRLLILCEIASGLVWVVADSLLKSSLPPELRGFTAAQRNREWGVGYWLSTGGFLLVVVGWIGLWRLWWRARVFYTAGWLLGIVAASFMGPHVYSGPPEAAALISTVAAGLILGMIYFSDLRHRFDRAREAPVVAAEHGSADSLPRFAALAADSPPLRFTGSAAVARASGAFRRSVRAHLGAGGLAVVGIAGLGTVYMFPIAVLASPTNRGLRVVLVSAVSLAFAVAVWLLAYLPLSVVTERITQDRITRVCLPAVVFVSLAGTAVLVLTHLYDQPPHIMARIVSLGHVVLLGLGCALYSMIKQWLVNRALKEQGLAP